MGVHSKFTVERNGKHRSTGRAEAGQQWEVYIAALRGNRTSVAPDIHKIKAESARQRAEERFFRSRHKTRHLLKKKY